MSVSVLTWAMKQQAGGSGPKAVLMALAYYADAAGECWPSQTLLAEACEMGISTVRLHLTSLEQQSLIVRVRRYRKNGARSSNAYRLNVNGDNAPVAILPPESGCSLPPESGGIQAPESGGGPSLPPDIEGESSVRPPESGARPESPESYRQNLEGLPPDLEGATSLEPSGEQNNITVVVVDAGDAQAPASDSGGNGEEERVITKDEALELMKAAAVEAARNIDDQQKRRAFSADVRVIVTGDDMTSWRNAATGLQVPWAERPPLLNIAIAHHEAGRRDTIRAALILAIQQQKDPMPVKVASCAIPKDSPAGKLRDSLPRDRNGKVDETGLYQPKPGQRIGDPAEAEKKEREDRGRKWLKDHPDQARQLEVSIRTAAAGNSFLTMLQPHIQKQTIERQILERAMAEAEKESAA